ncbi:hypothetical protein [Curtobacterium sp. MCBA15_001]|uniref:hypothetical protein n=1 Tax=Curtobacterium sp. MCBA15_001 TaxID=1898731 RepID=UPI0008DD868A|nr:hypothetical protein [Curtobacterium sp. MCBA15_001]OIH98190.1 hypothetical protein BIU90_12520 [Curtobacterium sp. MCBA15_001]
MVDDTQYRADGALADAKDAAGDLTAAQGRLSDAQSTLSHYQSTARSLTSVADQYPTGSEVPAGVDVPSPAQLRAASDNTTVAQGSVSSATKTVVPLCSTSFFGLSLPTRDRDDRRSTVLERPCDS